jgi:hypothetical protein
MDWDACSEAASTLEVEECAAYAYTCMCKCIYAHIQSNIHYTIHKHIVRVRECETVCCVPNLQASNATYVSKFAQW